MLDCNDGLDVERPASNLEPFLQPIREHSVIRKPAASPPPRRLDGKRRPRTKRGGRSTLTPREIEVLHHFSRGLRYAEVATEIGVSLNTVTSHVKNAYRKLQVHTAAAAVMRAVQLRLIGQTK
jgi:DNA-binding CsgD family transcriptional regulator